MITADKATIRAHLEFLFGPDADRVGRIELDWVGPTNRLNQVARFGTIEGAVEAAAKHNTEGRPMYVGAGLRRPDMPAMAIDKHGQLRPLQSTANDVVSWSALVWDMDKREVTEAGLEIADKIGLPFHWITQTGARRNGGEPDLRLQCWVKLDELLTDMAEVKRLLSLGIKVFGSDPAVKNGRHVMRLAGSVAWARKDGRQDELTLARYDLMSFKPPLPVEEVEAILMKAAPAPKVGKAARAPTKGDGGLTIPKGPVWRDSPGVRTLLRDLLEGDGMNPSSFELALKAARDGHGAPAIQAALAALYDQCEAAGVRPERVVQLRNELSDLAKRAVEAAGGPGGVPYAPAAEDIGPADDGDVPPPDARERMFAEFAWCESLKSAIEISTGAILDRMQLDARMPEIGHPGKMGSAWDVLVTHKTKRRDVAGLTFRPGADRLVDEREQGREGLYVNTWRPLVRLPNTPDDEGVRVFLDHAAFVIPDGSERETALDWMAWVAQHQGEKPNWALVMGSTHEGVGKDLLLEGLRRAIGAPYVQEIDASQLIESFNSWVASCKLLIIQEMENFERRRTANLLKPLVASPPTTLLVNEKNVKKFRVPNLLACVFMTNERNALQVGTGDRRYFVTWNDRPPREKAYYDALVEWLENGGAALVAAWLMARDVSNFDARGRAPWTAAKGDMRRAGLPPIQEWIETAIADRETPFHTDLVSAEVVRKAIPWDLMDKHRPSAQRTASALQQAHCLSVAKLWSTGSREERERLSLWSCREHDRFAEMAGPDARAEYERQRAEAEPEVRMAA